MRYLAADDSDVMFHHNLKFCKGILQSPSMMRELDPNLSGVVSRYEAVHTDREKEAVFEEVRKAHYPHIPSRMGALYLFPDLDTAIKANQRWWGGKCSLYGAIIQKGSSSFTADSKWLDCTAAEFEESAHSYFSGERTNDPCLEVIVMGTIEVSEAPVNA